MTSPAHIDLWRRARRFWALALICLSLAGQYASFAHLVTVRHVVCPEHGELREAQGAAAVTHPGAVALHEPPLAEDRRQVSAAAESGHTHDHCLMLAQRRGQSVPRLAVCVLPATAHRLSQRPPSAASAAKPPIALLRLAPKNSPPV